MKTTFCALFIIFSSSMLLSQKVVQTFYRSGFNNSGVLELFDDNTFIMKYNSISCVVDMERKRSGAKEIHGSYTLRNKNLRFTPEYQMTKNYEDEELQRSREYVLESSFFKFDYDILSHNGEHILFAAKQLLDYKKPDLRFDNHYVYIANKLNETDSIAYFDSDFWREKSVKDPIIVSKVIKSIYPEAYQGYVLDVPIVGKVIDVESVRFIDPFKELDSKCTKYRVTLDVGKSEGVMPLMIFYGEKESNGNRCIIHIQDVFEEKSAGYIRNCAPHYNCILEAKYSTKK